MMKKITFFLILIICYASIFGEGEYQPQPVPQEALFYLADDIPRTPGIVVSSILAGAGIGFTLYSTYNLIEMGVEDQNPEMVAYTGLSLIFTGLASLILKYFILRE